MKQIFQSLKNGNTTVQDIPAPSISSGNVLIKSKKTLVSAGTERMLVDFGKANLIDKARQQPDKVKLVIEKIITNGFKPTLESVFAKLEEPKFDVTAFMAQENFTDCWAKVGRRDEMTTCQ